MAQAYGKHEASAMGSGTRHIAVEGIREVKAHIVLEIIAESPWRWRK